MDIRKELAELIKMELVKQDVAELTKNAERSDAEMAKEEAAALGTSGDYVKRMNIDPDEVTSKDEMRIEDIRRHAAVKFPPGEYRSDHERNVARQMAAKITDPSKAYRRYRYADASGYHHIAGEYYARAKVLGHECD